MAVESNTNFSHSDIGDCNICSVNKCQGSDEDMTDKYDNVFPYSLTAHIDDHVCDNNKVHCDAAIPDKTVGFLSHSVAQFSFTGPDRLPVYITNIEQCFHTADIIASTGCPNYAQARIPLVSGLNIEEWEKELRDYPDKMLIEYLKFGFPLSLSDPDSLHNVNITNHHSALQYPAAVDGYLRKETALGAIVGPVSNIDSNVYHCSPLLSRPKDHDKRRIILNLSHPYGSSLNERVPRDKFDGQKFTLKFPSVDDIVDRIVSFKGQDPVCGCSQIRHILAG